MDLIKSTKNIINCKYYSIDEIQSLNNLSRKCALVLFHMMTYSLATKFAELESTFIANVLITDQYPYYQILTKFLKDLHYLCNFLEINSLICDLQFGFKQKCSTPHALIHLTERTREQPDRGHFASGILVDLQNVFDTVDHDILIQKSNHYCVRGVANNCFSSYLQNRLQYVSVNCSNSKLS